MSSYSTEHKRETLAIMKERDKRHQQQQGKQPTQRELDRKWSGIAERMDRQGKA